MIHGMERGSSSRNCLQPTPTESLELQSRSLIGSPRNIFDTLYSTLYASPISVQSLSFLSNLNQGVTTAVIPFSALYVLKSKKNILFGVIFMKSSNGVLLGSRSKLSLASSNPLR